MKATKAEVLNILNMMRARTRDEDFCQSLVQHRPGGHYGYSAPYPGRGGYPGENAAGHPEPKKRRELMWEDGIRWIDLLRWDKDYAMQITNADSENKLYLPIHTDEILRNPKLEQNPAY